MSQYQGASWILQNFKKPMSPLGEQVADLLGDVFLGIYHLDYNALKRVQWDDTIHVEIVLSFHSLDTVDSGELTRLVVLCHDRALRMSIRAVAPKRLELMFHQRKRGDDWCECCPTMEEHIEKVRKSL